MSKDLIEKSKQVLAKIEFNDTTYEVARNVVLDEIEKLQNQLKKEKSRYKALQKNSNWFSNRVKDRNGEIERLNNIINELEKELKNRIKNVPDTMVEVYEDESILNKLQELKNGEILEGGKNIKL